MVGGGAGLESANLGSLAAAACLSTAVERSRGAETPGAPPPTPIPAPVVLPAELRCSLQAEWARQLDAERLLATALEGLSALDQAAKRHLPELEDRLLGLLKGCVAAGGKLDKQEAAVRRELEQRLSELTTKLHAADALHAAVAQKRQSEGYSDAALTAVRAVVADLESVDMSRPEALSVRALTPETARLVSMPREALPSPLTLRRDDPPLDLDAGVTAVCQDGAGQGTLIVGLQSGRILRVSIATRSVDTEFPGHQYPVTVVSVLVLRGRWCLCSSARDKTVRIADLQTQQPLHCLTEHSGCVTAMHVVAGTLFTTSLDGTVSYWHLRHGRRQGALVRVVEHLHSSLFTPDGELYVGCRNGSVIRHSTDTSDQSFSAVATAQWGAHKGAVLCMALHTGGFLVTGGADCTACLWDLGTADGSGAPRWVRTLRHHVDSVTAVLPTQDGLLFTASADALVVCWHLCSGAPLQVLKGHYHSVAGLAIVSLPRPLPGGEDAAPTSGVKQTYSELRKLFAIPDDMFDSPQPPGWEPDAVAPQQQPPAAGQKGRGAPRPQEVAGSSPASDDVSRWETAAPSSSPLARPVRPSSAPQPPTPAAPQQQPAAALPAPELDHFLVSASADKTIVTWAICPQEGKAVELASSP
eukprot:TRINITY_DN8482_c0_g1_i2.p1 TRINITY_DN8482_c0_g1~~TRINITY_DN8482_c0_g1_i2.p1  ORF type:complete len:668 (+),score=208.27 TRINITY_DN8482_c0_g1_i2:80-2005(+)